MLFFQGNEGKKRRGQVGSTHIEYITVENTPYEENEEEPYYRFGCKVNMSDNMFLTRNRPMIQLPNMVQEEFLGKINLFSGV